MDPTDLQSHNKTDIQCQENFSLQVLKAAERNQELL
jgi:hypothetical protein